MFTVKMLENGTVSNIKTRKAHHDDKVNAQKILAEMSKDYREDEILVSNPDCIIVQWNYETVQTVVFFIQEETLWAAEHKRYDDENWVTQPFHSFPHEAEEEMKAYLDKMVFDYSYRTEEDAEGQVSIYNTLGERVDMVRVSYF